MEARHGHVEEGVLSQVEDDAVHSNPIRDVKRILRTNLHTLTKKRIHFRWAAPQAGQFQNGDVGAALLGLLLQLT